MGLSILLCFGSGYVLITGVSTPLVEMTKAMDELAGGNLQAHVPNADQQDEIGHLAGSMTAFKNQLVAAERSKAEQTELIVGSIGTGLENLAKGNVTHRIDAELVGPFAKLKSNFNAAMDRLQDTLKSVMASTSQITTGAGEISQASDDLSRRTEQQAAKQIKTLINASGEQVGSGVRLVGESGAALRRIMDQVQQINSLVSEMALAAEQQSTGIEQVNAAVGQMDQVTQQNAAMVEQSTAAARNLASETQSLQELVGFFDVGRGTETVRRPEPQQRKVVKPSMPAARPAPRPVRVASRGGAQPAQAADAGDWTEF
jgi:methyl-accepting chemotaxis protein